MKKSRPIPVATLNQYLDHRAVGLLRTYFSTGTFTGGRFERFAGGGDRADVANVITAEDIVAVSMLGVRIPGAPALAMLEELQPAISALLTQIPLGVDLWDAAEETVNADAAAKKLWTLLVGLPGIEWVTAGKLMARKRPRLIPVYDRVVHKALERPSPDAFFWTELRRVLLEKPDVLTRLREIRDELSLFDISLLRILDVAIWMGAYGQPLPVPDEED
jgi:hypothetical protein